jgi:hypothetical protein
MIKENDMIRSKQMKTYKDGLEAAAKIQEGK